MTTATPRTDTSPNATSWQTPHGLRAVQWGDGERLVVGFHGWNGSTATFAPLVEHLPDDVSLLAFDLPGYGESPEPEAWSMPSIAEMLVDALESNAIEACSLLGNCSGTATTLFVAREAERRGIEIDRCALIEPFSYVPWYLRLLLMPFVGWGFYWLAFGTGIGRSITDAFLADKRDDSIDLMAAFAESPLHVPYRYLELFDSLPDPETFGDVPGDKVVMQTEHTFRAVRRSVERFRRIWSELEVHELPSTGHLPLEERPEAVAGHLL